MRYKAVSTLQAYVPDLNRYFKRFRAVGYPTEEILEKIMG